MKKTILKGIFNDFINLRKDWDDHCLKPNPLYLSIAWFLCKNDLAGVVEDVSDLMMVYDNLVINNEILTEENFNEYDPDYYCKFRSLKTVKKYIFKDNKIILLNYYKNFKNKNNCTVNELQYCFIVLDPGYLWFDEKLNFIR